MNLGLLKKGAKFLGPFGFLLLAALLVWRFGPRIGINRPANVYIAVTLAVLALLAFVTWLIWIWIERRLAKRFVEGMEGQAAQDASRGNVRKREEIQNLTQKWKDAVVMLQRATRRTGNVVNTLPWFAIIGESQSGKSTLLKNSGLDFPIGDAAVAGIGGTKNCDWWFANEGIILDTAGRYTFEVDNAPDRDEWRRFLELVRKTRKRKALNGLLVVIPTDVILQKDEEELERYALHLRSKINEMMTGVGSLFPVYVVITKFDLTQGFVEFFHRLPAGQIREAMGCTVTDARPEEGLQAAEKCLDELYDRLCSMSLRLMSEEASGDETHGHLLFPEEYRTLATRVKILLRAMLKKNIYMENPLFRGLYLTSGTQIGTTIASSIVDVARKLGMDLASLTTEHAADRPKRAYFVRDLLSRILVGDAQRDIVRPLEGGARREMMSQLWRVFVPATAVTCLLLVWSFLAYGGNSAAWRDLRSAVLELPAPAARPADPLAISKSLEYLAGLDHLDDAAVDRSSLGNLFLNRSGPDTGEFGRLFRREAESRVIGPMLDRNERKLRQPPGDLQDYLESLAAITAYHLAVSEGRSDNPAELKGLAAAWSEDPGGEEISRRAPELAAIVARYVAAHGDTVRPSIFSQAARRLDSRMGGSSESAPSDQLVELAGRIAGTPRNDAVEEQLRGWLGELRTLAQEAGGGLKVDPNLPARIIDEARRVPGAQDIIPPLQKLAGILGGGQEAEEPEASKPREAFKSLVVTPLQAALNVQTPKCPAADFGDPQKSIKDTAKVLSTYGQAVQAAADALSTGIEKFNESLPSDHRKVNSGAVHDALVDGQVSALLDGCSRGWFEEGELLGTDTLTDLVVEKTGRGGSQLLVPPGIGLFRCAIRISQGEGPKINQQILDGIDTELNALMDTDGVSRDLRHNLRDSWLARKSAFEVAPGGTNWTNALGKVRLDTPPGSWAVEQIPDKLNGAKTLEECLKAISSGLTEAGDRTRELPIRTFDYGERYISDLQEMGGDIGKAVSAGEDGLVDLVVRWQAMGPQSPIEKARSEAKQGPQEIRADLETVPRAVWEKLLSASKAGLARIYREEVKGSVRDLSGCYPLSAGSQDCDLKTFSDLFGKGGPVEKTSPLVSGNVLDLGPKAKEFFTQAARIQRTFVSGGKNATLAVVFKTQQPKISLAEGVKSKDFNAKVDTLTLLLSGNEALTIKGDDPPKSANVVIPLVDAGSGLRVKLARERARSGVEKFLPGGEYLAEDLEAGVPNVVTGPWSALRFLETGRHGGTCCTWDLPLYKVDSKKRREKTVATIHVRLDLVHPPGEATIVDPDFWSLGSAPESLEE